MEKIVVALKDGIDSVRKKFLITYLNQRIKVVSDLYTLIKEFNMQRKALCISAVKQHIGWVYSDLKWPTEKEAELANKKRDQLLQYLSNKASFSFMQSKIHIGKLSPGCLICGGGHWSCLYINGLCTAHCFYCPQDRKMQKERLPKSEGVEFNTPDEYIAFLEKFNFKGVGFSGGEPLLVFDKLLTYIRKVREKFGKNMYIWAYTNGDLVNEDKLRKLKEAGLDEIRFDISTRNYDLRPVELATHMINAVTIEIPSIPEDYGKVKNCLAKMQEIGVKHLNLHQLYTTQNNYKNFVDRGYTFTHGANLSMPIFESEITALELIKYALDEKIDLSINYCSTIYKNRFQEKGARAQRAPLVKKDFEELTDSMFIRKLSIQDSPSNINKIIEILQENKCEPNLWSLNGEGTEIFIHSGVLKYIDSDKHGLMITYFFPILQNTLSSGEEGVNLKLSSNREIFIKKQLVVQQKFSSAAAIKSFQKLFIDHMNEREVLEYFHRNYGLKTNEDFSRMKKEMEALIALKSWECLDIGFPEIY